jgi:hypothetical protein
MAAKKIVPWQERTPEALIEVETLLAESWPTLRTEIRERRVAVTGTYPVRHEALIVAEYRVDVVLPDNYPGELPVVRELDGKIPREAEFHVNPADGTLCVVLPDEFWLEHDTCDLGAFLAGPLHTFFLGVLHYARFGEWPFGEHAHGSQGSFEFYCELIGTSDRAEVLRYLGALGKLYPKGHWKCPCGSGKRLRKCHWKKLLALRAKVSRRRAVAAAAALAKIG